MDKNIVISIKNLTKTYKLYSNHADRVKETFNPFRKKYHHPFNALNNISFNVKRGEMLGIIGRNGSGKSTLLQIICGILQPTSGSIEINGRVSALLELGAGFNPEFTGRQNVYINSAILGLKHEEIDARFDDIVTFAEIGNFIDQPVKTYSSGMYVRLAFAVAINVDADILIVDEALAVGDEIFQRKCFSRIRQMRKSGITILFVSHSAPTVVELCDKAILLDQGELLLAGSPKFVVSKYHKLIYAPKSKVESLREEIRATSFKDDVVISESDSGSNNESSQVELDEPALRPFYDPNLVAKSTVSYESRGVRIEDVQVTTLKGEVANILVRREEYLYTYSVKFQETSYNVRFGMMIKTVSGLELGGAASSPIHDAINCIEAGASVLVKFRFRCLLQPGVYFLNAGVLGIVDGSEVFLHRIIDYAMFRVQSEENLLSTSIVDFCAEPIVSIQYQ
jgi:lipopolysaccharide transport system ATP-binding protein